MATAAQTVTHALSFVGITETPPDSNCNIFSDYLGRPCHYWCADFTVAVLRQMDVPIPAGADTASTRLNLAAWKKAGQWVEASAIQPGDIVFFHLSDRNGTNPSTPSHTGVATRAYDGRVRSVDGNTSSDDTGDQENGGIVATKNRRVGVVIGAGRPAYASTPPPTPEPEDESVSYIYIDKTGQDAGQVYDSGSILMKIPTGEDAQAFRDAGAKEVKLSHQAWSTLNDEAKG